jgi:hypothetical protein
LEPPSSLERLKAGRMNSSHAGSPTDLAQVHKFIISNVFIHVDKICISLQFYKEFTFEIVAIFSYWPLSSLLFLLWLHCLVFLISLPDI